MAAENQGRRIALVTTIFAALLIVGAVVTVVVMNVATPSLSRFPDLAPAAGEAQAPGRVASAPAVVTPVLPAPVIDQGPACNYGDLVGQNVGTIQQTRFGGHPVRTLKPGMQMTMEYLEGRINLHVNKGGVITAVTCG